MSGAAAQEVRPKTVRREGAFERVGCSLLTFAQYGLDEALDAVEARGFTRVDLGIVPGHCDHVDLLALTPAAIDQLREALGRRGLSVSSVNLFTPDMAAPDFGTAERRIRAAIDLARRLDAGVLTLPPGPMTPPETWDGTAGVVAGRVRALLGLAEQAGVKLSLEAPHARTLADDLDQARRLFELIGDPRVGCTFDTSHVRRASAGPMAAAVARLGVPVVHVHLRDTLRGEVLVTPGKGDCDFLPLIQALQRDGYQGDFNFELEYESPTREKIEQELGFATEHLRMQLSGRALPFSHRVYRQGWYRAYDAARWVATHPKDFIIAHPSLKAVLRPPVRAARHVRDQWVPYRDLTYRAGWQPVWRVGRKPSGISERPAPVPAGAPIAERRVAILGCGYTGRFQHGPGFARLPGVKVVGVCDVQPDRAVLLGGRLGVPHFTDAAELLARTKPDLVVNCTREWQHRDTTLMSFDAGADVFCEKILAESLEAGETLVRAAREKGRVLGVNYNWRFLPGIQRIREIRDSGELGKLRMLRILAHAWVHHHALDLVRYLGGPVGSVSATIEEAPETRGLAEWNKYTGELIYMPTIYCVATLQTKDGVGVSLASTELMDPKGVLLSIDAAFEQGTLTLSGILDRDALGTLTASARKPVDVRLTCGDAPAGFALSFQRSIEGFVAACRSGTTPPTSGEDGLDVMRLENALVRSHQSGARVLL